MVLFSVIAIVSFASFTLAPHGRAGRLYKNDRFFAARPHHSNAAQTSAMHNQTQHLHHCMYKPEIDVF